MKHVLFACVENSCRSQMAEGFANIHGTNILRAFSAGSKASGEVNNKAVAAMKEIGYDLTEHKSKGVDEFSDLKFDYLITQMDQKAFSMRLSLATKINLEHYWC